MRAMYRRTRLRRLSQASRRPHHDSPDTTDLPTAYEPSEENLSAVTVDGSGRSKPDSSPNAPIRGAPATSSAARRHDESAVDDSWLQDPGGTVGGNNDSDLDASGGVDSW